MKVLENHVFNLLDTNGRRKDVINALNIYLSILKEGFAENPNFVWSAFPNSLSEFNFYKKAIEASPDVFCKHPKFDVFYDKYSDKLDLFENGNKQPLKNALDNNANDRKSLDVDIESRARHYSSNLCKLGFVHENRTITSCGNAFLGENFDKDVLENIFPLSNTNIVILRQLLKLKVFSGKLENGDRKYYSPIKMGLYLLLTHESMEEDDFRTIVQSISPYFGTNPDSLIDEYFTNGQLAHISIKIPGEFDGIDFLPMSIFGNYFKNFKSAKTEEVYYEFYKCLYNFRINRNERNYKKLISVLQSSEGKEKIKKAFGFGRPVFDLGNVGYDTGLEFFLLRNEDNELLNCDDFNAVLYKRYIESKYTDAAREYSDTTKRMFNATGLFKFNKGLCSLAYKDILCEIFNVDDLKNEIFGTFTANEFDAYEGFDNDQCYFYCNHSLCEILNISEIEANNALLKINENYGTDISGLADAVEKKASANFIEHIKDKYPREKVLEILSMFSNRDNDPLIQEYVNPEATVPTIYEYITALAWYYISDEKIDVYNSLNLTLNADFEPILHAAGGDGDIVIQEDGRVVMLEVTLMNKHAQKSGELEPVLRHSTNLKARYSDKETITFFIADELDFNTTNTWRYLFTSEQMATISSQIVSGVAIMSFTNKEICSFIEKHVTSSDIINKTKESFTKGNEIPHGWREQIVNSLIS